MTFSNYTSPHCFETSYVLSNSFSWTTGLQRSISERTISFQVKSVAITPWDQIFCFGLVWGDRVSLCSLAYPQVPPSCLSLLRTGITKLHHHALPGLDGFLLFEINDNINYTLSPNTDGLQNFSHLDTVPPLHKLRPWASRSNMLSSKDNK